MYIAARADRRRFRLRHDRHSVPAGAEGPAAGQRPGRRHAEQRRPAAGHAAATASACCYDGEPLPHFNEVDECAGLDGADDLPRPQGDGPAGREHAARSALGRLGPLGHGERLRLGVPDQRLRAAGPFHRRLAGRHERAAAADVLSLRRRHAQGHLQARRDRLVADLRRTTAG